MVGQFPNSMFAINRSNVTRRLLAATILLLSAGNICHAQDNTTAPAAAATDTQPVRLEERSAQGLSPCGSRQNPRIQPARLAGRDDKPIWRVRFHEPCRPAGTFVPSAGDQKVEGVCPKASDWYKCVTLDSGVLGITAAGEQELILRPVREPGQEVMKLRAISLERLP